MPQPPKKNIIVPKRLQDETDKQWRAFVDYAEMEDRSLNALATYYNQADAVNPPTTSVNTLKTWSVKNFWAERIREAEAEVNELEYHATSEAVQEVVIANAKETAQDKYAEVLKYRDQSRILGNSGISIGSTAIIIVQKLLASMQNKEKVDDRDLARIAIAANAYRAFFVQGVPVANEMLATSLGVTHVLDEMRGGKDAA